MGGKRNLTCPFRLCHIQLRMNLACFKSQTFGTSEWVESGREASSEKGSASNMEEVSRLPSSAITTLPLGWEPMLSPDLQHARMPGWEEILGLCRRMCYSRVAQLALFSQETVHGLPLGCFSVFLLEHRSVGTGLVKYGWKISQEVGHSFSS